MDNIYDSIIIGTGISGLTSAILLKEAGLNVLVITKNEEISESNTNYAQGGIVAWKEEDNPAKLLKDILVAGDNYNNKEAVEELAKNGPKLVFDFLIEKIGVPFNKDTADKLDYTEEAAHSTRRILHVDDHTGDVIIEKLITYTKKLKIPILVSTTAVDLITNNHHSKNIDEIYKEREVLGVYALNNLTGKIDTYFSHSVVLSTGGLGNLFQYTTNPTCATGDGLSMAYRAGADIINAEFIQFHPTCLFHKDLKRFLISESLRGEGAKLVDHEGKEFMYQYHKDKDLAPRNIVARAIYDQMYKNGKEYMYLDLSNHYKGKRPIKERFSKIYSTCIKAGIDITNSPIPVVPASHYFCGGIKVDINGLSTIKNLYAIGEVSCTGIHGANRLASVSLLEGLYWAKTSSQHIINKIKNKKDLISFNRFKSIPNWSFPKYSENFDNILIDQDWRVIKLTMWNYAGIIRTQKGLLRAQADLSYYAHRIFRFYKEAKLNKSIIELRNAIINSQIIVNAALQNNKSIGCHYISKDE